MNPLKLVFVLPSLHGGGAERAALRLLQALPPDRYASTLYLFEREGAYLNDVPEHVRLVVGARGGRFSRFAALRRFLAVERFDAAVSFLSHFVVFSAVRAARVGTRFIISQQTPLSAFLDDADYHWRRPSHRAIFVGVARRMYPRADLIIATSRGVASDLIDRYGARPERTAVVPNPVDVDEVERLSVELLPADLDVDGSLIVTAGRLAEAKNFPLLIDALTLLHQRQVPFRAWILGQGELEADVRRRISAAGLEGQVRLLGFQANPWKFMAAADVFVLTSKYEGFGNVLVEAMASGAAVVATASFGTRDIVRHEETGLLIEEHSPDAVASALERLIVDTTVRARLRCSGKTWARSFAVTRVAEDFGARVAQAVATAPVAVKA